MLAESAERRQDIDLVRAKDARRRAEERLAEDRAKEEIDIVRAKAALERAVQRIKLSGSI